MSTGGLGTLVATGLADVKAKGAVVAVRVTTLDCISSRLLIRLVESLKKVVK